MKNSESVARTILGGIAGAVAGPVLALAACSLPMFFMRAQDAGVIGFVMLLWLAPAGVVVGAIAGGLAERRFGLGRVAAATVLSVVVGLWVSSAADDHAMPPLVSASGCRVIPLEFTSLASGTVMTADWICPEPTGQQRHVSIVPGDAPLDPTTPGNVLVLDASTDAPSHSPLVVVTDDTSGFTVAYDHRARVLRQASHVGVKPVRYLDLDARGIPRRDDTAASAPAAPPAPSETASPTCRNDVREWGVVQRWSVTIFRRSCAGQPATIDVSVIPSRATFDQEAPGNVLSFDASAETPADTIRVRVASFDGRALMIGHDRRTFARRFSSSMEKLRIGTVVETDSALRRGSFDRQPSTPAAR